LRSTILEDERHALDCILPQATPESAIFERPVSDLVPLDEIPGNRHNGMVSTGGRVFLLGDAAHAMHNAPGQVSICKWWRCIPSKLHPVQNHAMAIVYQLYGLWVLAHFPMRFPIASPIFCFAVLAEAKVADYLQRAHKPSNLESLSLGKSGHY
jgi:hypothetical protein